VPALYIVATPIGNLEDISLRAIRILKEVGMIAAEDTRTTRKLLEKYGIGTRLTSYHEYNKKTKLRNIIDTLKTEDVALVSEAGMPGISDAGYELVVKAIENGYKVTVIPGATAVITAVVLSGLPANQFVYLGFLPRRKGYRKSLLKSMVNEQKTIVVFESPHRINDSLADIINIMGNRRIAVCRELTKIHEEVFRGTVSQAIEHFNNPRGEFTLVIEGAEVSSGEIALSIEEELQKLYDRGVSSKEAINTLASSSGISKKKLYSCWLNIKERS